MGLPSKFIFLTMHQEMSVVVEAFRSGASAFVLKTAPSSEFTEAMTIVLAGGHYLSRQFPCDLASVIATAGGLPGDGKLV